MKWEKIAEIHTGIYRCPYCGWVQEIRMYTSAVKHFCPRCHNKPEIPGEDRTDYHS